MSTISNIGKISYIYHQPTDTWHPIAGMTDSSANFSWTGNHVFGTASDITINKSILAKNGINNFANISERNSKIPTPADGTFALFVNGSSMHVQYFHAGAWRLFGSDAYIEERNETNFVSGVYTLQVTDPGKTLDMNAAAQHTVKIPLDATLNLPIGSQVAFIQANTGQTVFDSEVSGLTSVTILSKNSNKKLAARYSQAILIKKAANTWYLMGDLTA